MARTRRWDLSEEELERIALARKGTITAGAAVRALLRNPRLAGEAARIVADSVRNGLTTSNSLSSLITAERARAVVPDAATGVGWYDEQPFLDALAPWTRPAARALELGCGAGRISRHVAPLVAELICTDMSAAMIAEARENLRMFANAKAQTTDGWTLSEFDEKSFDIVLGQGVLGYLGLNHLLALLAEIRRVLRPGGVTVFNFMTIDDPLDAAQHLEAVLKMARRRRPHGGVDQAYTRAQLDAMHTLAGLDVVAPERREPGERGRIVIVGRRTKQ